MSAPVINLDKLQYSEFGKGARFGAQRAPVSNQIINTSDEAMKPHTSEKVYVNYLGDEGEDRVKAAYAAPTYQKLVALKNSYDPDNVFQLIQNIRRAGKGINVQEVNRFWPAMLEK